MHFYFITRRTKQSARDHVLSIIGHVSTTWERLLLTRVPWHCADNPSSGPACTT